MATILVVDDRRENREYLVTLLGYHDHRLMEAADGAEALSIARTERPNLIIADILMPTMDGYELVRQLRGDPAIAQTPVIFWTADYHEREALALARTCGVSMVITKPSEPETILNAVEAALGLSPPAEAHPPAAEQYDREHLRLLTDKLSQKANDLKGTNERLSALIELSLQLASELDLRRLLQSFGHAARRIIGARYSVIGVLDEGGTRFQHLYTSGLDAASAVELGSPDPQAPVLKTILGHGMCTRRRNLSGNPADLGFSRSHPEIHSWLGAPVTSPTRIYGYIGLCDRLGLEEFSEEDEHLAQILAAQVGRIYQNGSLYSEALNHASALEREIAARTRTETALAERAQQSLLIGEVGTALTRGDSLQGMLQLCAEGLIRNLNVAFAGIWIFNQAENILELEASAAHSSPKDTRHRRVPSGQLMIGRVAQQRAPRFTNDLLNDPDVGDAAWLKREGIVAFAGYPLMIEDRLLGVVRVLSRRPLSTATVDALGSVASEIALGIERMRSNETLREREEHIRLLLDSTAEAIYGIDLQGRCTFANPTCTRLLGYAGPNELQGRNMQDLIHHSGRLQNEGSHVDDELFRRADGSTFPVEYWSYPICREGQVVGAVVTFLDITERKSAEETQSALRAQLQQAQKLESIGRLAGGVAHDFNNLLTVINGYADLSLRQLKPEDPMRQDLGEILKAGQQAANLTRQLLLLSRKQVTQPRNVNVNDVLTEVEKMLARVIGEDIRLEFVLSPALEYVWADPGQLHQVLMNLAVNARDAMPNGGTLLIETGNVDLGDNYVDHHVEVKPGPYIQIRVSDTGIGMTKDVLAHLFEPFFTTKSPGEGTGLGLATVYGIVKQCEGSIQVYSEPGRGTTFSICLPHAGKRESAPKKREKPPQSLRGTETILVVEDQEQLRKMAAGVLRSYGYRVLESANPGEALLLSERHAAAIHLMLSDVVMPGMTGPELAARIRPLRPAMEVAFMSGYSERAVTDRMQLVGSYLAKPFSPEALAVKVREVLGSPRPLGTILVVDDESAVRKVLRKVLSGAGYAVLEATSGKEALQELRMSDVDLVIADLSAREREGIRTLRAMRKARPQLGIITMSVRFAGSAPHAVESLGAHATLPKPIRPDELLDVVARVASERGTSVSIEAMAHATSEERQREKTSVHQPTRRAKQ